MYDAAPVEVTAHLSFVGILLFGGIGLGFLFVMAMIVNALTGRSHREQSPAATESSSSRHSFAMILLPCILLIGLFLTIPLLWAVRAPTTNVDRTGPAVIYSRHAPPMNSAVPEGGAVEGSSTESLPGWTQNKETVIADGQVPRVLFVESSGLYSSEAEAMNESMTNAISKFRARLAETSETYRKLADQPVPEHIFREVVIQQVYREKRMHSFGVYEEPMYRVYMQYMDSAETREPIIDAWKSTFASNRAMQYGIGFGVLIALLGVVSAGLRALSAARGSRGRAVMTALAFAGLGLVGLLFVA